MQPLAPGLAGLLIGALGLAPAIAGEASVAAWLERHRERPGAVRAFVQRLPKGADLHSHLSGAVYAERYLEWAAADGFCVDPAKPALVAPGD